MGETISRAEFARRIGVSRSAVTIAVRRGTIASVDGNIDPDDPTAREWAEYHRTHGKASGGGRGHPVARVAVGEASNGEVVALPRMAAPSGQAAASNRADVSIADAHEIGKAVDVNLKKIKYAVKKLEYAEMQKHLVAADDVTRSLGILKAVLDENFRSFTARNGGELHELACAVDASKFAERLHTRIDEALDSALEAVEREIKKFRDGVPA